MEIDSELLEAFIKEISDLNAEILHVLKSLNENLSQPEEFLKFSNIIDRIYGTAATLGYIELGDYCLKLKTISRQAGNSQIQRSYGPVMKLMLNYTSTFKLLKESLEDPKKVKEFSKLVAMDIKKMENLEKEVFAYTDKKHSIIK